MVSFGMVKTGGGWPVVMRCLISILEAGSTPVPPTKLRASSTMVSASGS